MTSRHDILAALRAHPQEAPPLPDFASRTKYDDPIAQFETMLQSVGGHSVRVAAEDGVTEALRRLPVWTTTARVASTVEPVQGNVTFSKADNAHSFHNLDLTIASAEFCVAENGAVWINGATLPHQSLLFLPQHLAIVAPTTICQDMHEAYARLDSGPGKLGQASFGVFVSGPSKTADIEQSLVIGAHGPRSLTVVLHP